MQPASHQWTTYARWRAELCQADPHFPIFATTQTAVKTACEQPCRPPDDDVGTATWDGIVPRQRCHNLFRRERRLARHDSAIVNNIDGAGVGPVTAGRFGGAQLADKFVRRPEVVVV